MKSISRPAALLFLLLLPACGGDTPLAGEWVPDIYETRRRWENLLLDRENKLAQEGTELEKGFSRSATKERARIIEDYGKMGLRLTIHSATAFTFTRRGGEGPERRGSGRCEVDGDMVTLHPEEGAHFLRGRRPVKFLHQENRLVEVRLQDGTLRELFPVLLLKRP